MKLGRLAQQEGHVCPRVRQVLDVVEEEEEFFATKMIRERLRERLGARLLHSERLSDRGQHQLRLLEGCERDEIDAVRKPLDELGRRLYAESRLSAASWTDEREQTHVLEPKQLEKLPELALASYEWGGLRRQIRRLVVQSPHGRELRRQPLDQQLVELLRLGEVLQPVLAEIA